VIFHEIYSSYYQAVGRLITASLNGPLTDSQAARIIGESAFSDSFLYIADAVKSGQWPVLDRSWKTPLSGAPQRPLSTLERRWLATVCRDRRMALFCSEDGGNSWLSRLSEELKDVTPLYVPEDFSVVDGVLQSDPYDDPAYQKHFRIILSALRENRPVVIAFRSRKGQICHGRYQPQRLEYSQKEDRFRLLARSGRRSFFINLGRILECVAFQNPERLCEVGSREKSCIAGTQSRAVRPQENNRRRTVKWTPPKRQVELELTDERGALSAPWCSLPIWKR